MAMKGAIFLDKDGTLLEDVPYNVNPAQMRFAPGAANGLRRLARLELPLIVISNQPGVALGLFEECHLHLVRKRLAQMFASVGAPLDGFYYCMHHPLGRVPGLACQCECRKPAPGLVYRAAAEHGISLERSWFIGDILNDVEAGRRAGCETILLNNGNETEWLPGPLRVPHHVVEDLDQASLVVFERDAIDNEALAPMKDIA